MNPNAQTSEKGYQCPLGDAGVDLNRNYGYFWGVGEKITVNNQ